MLSRFLLLLFWIYSIDADLTKVKKVYVVRRRANQLRSHAGQPKSKKSPNTPKVTKTPKMKSPSKSPKNPKSTKGPKVTKAPKTQSPTKAPKATKAPKSTKSPKVTKAPKTKSPTKSPKTPKSTKSPKVTKAPKPTKSPKLTKAPKTKSPTKAPKSTKEPITYSEDCVDTPSYLFPEEIFKKDCEWLSKKESRKIKYCNKKIDDKNNKVKHFCRETCREFIPWCVV